MTHLKKSNQAIARNGAAYDPRRASAAPARAKGGPAMTHGTTIEIGPELADQEREIRVGSHVAYGYVVGGEIYGLSHAPTQADMDAVAAAIEATDELVGRDVLVVRGVVEEEEAS